LGEGIDWYFDWDTDTRHGLRAHVLYIKTLASIYEHQFQNMRYQDQLNEMHKERPHELLMLKQLRVATTTWVQAVGYRGTTFEEALRFRASITHGFPVIDKLRLCSKAILIFCACFETRMDDSLFRDLYARDLTFRGIWLDFLTSLLTYVETMNTCEGIKGRKQLESYVAQTRTLIKNARKQLNIERNNASKPWFVRNNTRRKKALAAFGRTQEDAGTLYNMRDILNEM